MDKELEKAIKKYNKIYIIELFVIAVVVITLATLKLLNIIGSSSNFRRVFNIITLVAAIGLLADFVWLCCSKKRQKRNSWFDKISVIPVPIAMLIFDIICLINWEVETIEWSTLFISIIFYYIGGVYIAQGIYHIFKPSPAMINAAIEEYNEKKEKQELEKSKDSNNESK